MNHFVPSIITRYFIVIITLIIALQCHAQDYRFEKIKPELNWPTGTINALMQDHQGMIWMGTQSGIARFDGQELRRWEYVEGDTNSLPSNYIWALIQDLNQGVWVGTDIGLAYWDRKTGHFNRIYKGDTYSYNPQANLDIQNRFWVKRDSLLFYLQKKTSSQFIKKEQLIPNLIDWKLLSKSQAIYWLNDSVHVVNLANDQEEQVAYWEKQLLGNKLNCIIPLQQKSGYLLVTEKNELLELDNQFVLKKNNYSLLNTQPYGRTHLLYQDSRGLIWICSDYGLWLWDKNQQERPKLVYDGGRTHRIIEDSEQNLWIGSDHGLLFFNARQLQFKFYGKKQHPMLGVRLIFGIEKSTKNEFWTAAMGGLFKLQSKKGLPNIDSITFYKYPQNIPLLSSVVKENDFLWVGSFIGLHKFHPKSASFELLDIDIKAPNDFDDDIFKLLKNNLSPDLWIATRKQLYRYTPKTTQLSPIKAELHGVLCSDARYIWSVQQKLLTYDVLMDTFSIYPRHPDSLLFAQQLEVTCLHKSETKPELWIGTSKGLYSFELTTKKIRHFQTTEGLSNERILAIGEDRQHRLWMSTDAGLNCYLPQKDTFYALQEKDGLPSKEFNQMSFYKDESGCFLFGCMSGLLVFNPDSILFELSTPNVVLTDLQLDYQSVLGDQKLNVPYDANLLGRLTLSSEYNMFGVHFVAPSYGAMEVTEYAFRLKDYNDDWIIKNATERFISYTNLPPGNYTLEIKAACHKNQWGAIFALPIVVLPAFYETWWFFFLCSFLGASIIGGLAYSYARYQYNKKVLELKTQQKIHAERARISRDLHDNVGANLSQIIMGLDILEYQLKKEANEKLIDKAKNINETARSGIQQLRDTVWALKKDAVSLQEFRQKIGDYLSGFYNSAESQLDWNISIDDSTFALSPNVMLNLFRIIQEASNNTLKYAEATKQTVCLTISQNKELVLLISDNGKGFVLEDYEQAIEHNGLKNMIFRAESLGGKCSINSVVGKGTTINVVISINTL